MAQQQSNEVVAEKQFPTQTTTVKLGDIPPLSSLVPHTAAPTMSNGKTWKRPNFFFKNESHNPDALPKNGDPLVPSKNTATPDAGGPEIIPMLNFDGLRDPDGVSPPDPVGDIGSNHYVQMVNAAGGARFQIFNKQGQSVYGPALTSTIWGQVQSSSIGDPIIQYDHDAQRWLMLEMQGFSENQLLVAVSDTDDPTGSWKAWRIQCVGFPDYPKLYVWDNAYFITVNEIVSSNQCVGYALNKSDMLDGNASVNTFRFVMPNFNAIQYQPATGADWEGGPPPPPGSPGLIFRLYDDAWDGGSDQIHMWQIIVDWDNPNNNFAFGPQAFNVAPFETRVCFGNGLFNCIEQPNTSQRITALENIIMYRAPYRNYGTHESIVLNHVTDVSAQVGDGGDAAVRWYEFRRNAGDLNWFVHQQGTYAPDLNNRFTGTISLDAQGNIGLGYSTASILTYPGIRLTGRRISDPPGTMPLQEYQLIPGTASHTGDSRWGDYSNMAVDPVDGKTFWFTAEYQPTGDDWATRIGSFQIRRDSYDITPVAIIEPKNAANLNNVQVKVEVLNGGVNVASNMSADLYVDNVLLASEALSGTIAPSSSLQHTFQPTLTWNNFNETKKIKVITRWPQDEFSRNDTIQVVVKKLTAYDAAYGGMADLPNLICTADYDLQFVLRNTSGLPLDSAQIRWKLNQSQFFIKKWYGHILPGEQDTVVFNLSGLTLPQNLFSGQIILPNGQPDQDSTNNKFNQKIYTNLNGSYLSASCTTNLGNLRYELRADNNNSLLDQFLFTSGVQNREICVVDGNCYTLTYRSTSFKWEGLLEIKDLYGNVLATVTSASPISEIRSLCAPLRKAKDVGAFSLISPVSAPGLTASEPITIEVKNFGTQKVGGIDVSWRVDNGNWNTETMTDSLVAGSSKSYTFVNSVANLSSVGTSYTIEVKTSLGGDELPSNDASITSVRHKVQRDIGIVRVEPLACSNINENNALIYLVNEGLEVVDSIRLTTFTNGVESQLGYYTPFFMPGDTFLIYTTLPAGILGANTLLTQVAEVNGFSEDQYLPNNTQSITYTIDANKVALDLSLSFDEKANESSWELWSEGGVLLDRGSGYENGFDYDFRSYCVSKDSCYVFKLLDSAGDGSDGYFNILGNSDAIWTYNGNIDTFTNELIIFFCANDACSGLSISTDIIQPNNAGMNNGRIQVIPTGGTPPYQYALNNGAYQSNAIFTNLTPGVYVVSVLDANGCYELLTVELGTIGTAQLALQRQLEIFPNPTQGPVWVKVPALATERTLVGSLTDNSGKLIRTIVFSRFDNTFASNFSLQKSPAGTYWLTIRDDKGSKIAEKRIQKI